MPVLTKHLKINFEMYFKCNPKTGNNVILAVSHSFIRSWHYALFASGVGIFGF